MSISITSTHESESPRKLAMPVWTQRHTCTRQATTQLMASAGENGGRVLQQSCRTALEGARSRESVQDRCCSPAVVVGTNLPVRAWRARLRKPSQVRQQLTNRLHYATGRAWRRGRHRCCLSCAPSEPALLQRQVMFVERFGHKIRIGLR